MKRFERSGRGQEPSRGHNFSILENFLSIRDFTSTMRLHFRSDLVGVAFVGARPLHLACARPRCRLKAPLRLSLLRCASQTRSHPKPCSWFAPDGANSNGVSCFHNFTEELSNEQEVQCRRRKTSHPPARPSTTTRRTTKRTSSSFEYRKSKKCNSNIPQNS